MGTVPLTCGGCTNSGLLPELHCSIAHIFLHSGKISVLDTCAQQILHWVTEKPVMTPHYLLFQEEQTGVPLPDIKDMPLTIGEIMSYL